MNKAGVKNAAITRKGGGRGKPFGKGNPGRPKGATNKATRDVREFCRGLVERPKYQQRLIARWEAGRIPPQIEAMVWHYAFGKPVQAIDLNTNFDPAKYLARDDEAPID